MESRRGTNGSRWDASGSVGRHPHADRIEADRIAAGDPAKKAYRAGALGRRVMVTGVDFVFRPQPTIYLLWAFGDEETRRVIEAAHERAIARVLEWIEDTVAVIRTARTASTGCGRPAVWLPRASATTRRGRAGRCSTTICCCR
ncbi:relaxase domain-containing protein [Streptomyces goshikiensis]|uniref:relaxase domain-containing protein n=1 Tax=Streptomyces goshikiensis TaxID=1942 RepID=UPI0037A3DF21